MTDDINQQVADLKKQVENAEKQVEINKLKARLDKVKQMSEPQKPRKDYGMLKMVIIIAGMILMGAGFVVYHYNVAIGAGMVFGGILCLGGWYAMKMQGM